MKLAIPVNDDHNTLCVSFARAPEFMMIDTQSGARICIKNPAADADGGAGIQAAQFLLDQEAEALLTPRCGENAGQVLAAGDVTIYKTTSTDIDAELAKFHQGTLDVLTDIHPGFHGHGFA